MPNVTHELFSRPVGRSLGFILIALLIVSAYGLLAHDAAQGQLLMPLDDVYIHFQYARQMALGEPYVYNPGGVPTSGATSFLYPHVLAAGYHAGFHGLRLGWWAMLAGALALIAAMEAVFRLCRAFGLHAVAALVLAWGVGSAGSLHWHFMSGMETGLVTATLLWVLLAVVQKRLRLFVALASILALLRPEGGIWTGIACVAMAFHVWSDVAKTRGKLLWLILPLLVIGLQPVANRLVTGSSVATGNQAKSILAAVPHDWTLIIPGILDNMARMWLEFFTGYGEQGWYLPPLLGLAALLGSVAMVWQRPQRWVGLMVLGWLLAGTAAISTLDTAFWHFKRYQIPMMALFVPLCANGGAALMRHKAIGRFFRPAVYAYVGGGMIFALALAGQFAAYHHANVSYVYEQPYQMALWLRDHTPPDSRVAVHDVGLMRYMGERETLDMVGLTTPGAAQSWRNGPGSVAEFLINEQPDYIASYGVGHGYGLRLLADTSLYGEPLAEFPVDAWQAHLNVALAAPYQAIYDGPAHLAEPAWLPDLTRDVPAQFTSSGTWRVLDVANLKSEGALEYDWQADDLAGFVTEYHAFDWITRDCEVGCVIEEAHRKINISEAFVMDDLVPGSGLLIQTLLHPSAAGTLDIFVGDAQVDTKWIPARPGTWLLIQTYIPPQFLTDSRATILLRPTVTAGYYMPALHVIGPGVMTDTPTTETLATYQEGALALLDVTFDRVVTQGDEFGVSFQARTDGQTVGDYRLFVHVYDDVNRPPVAQFDDYFVGMPLGNLLGGVWQDRIIVPLQGVPPGTYQLALGFYNPQDPQDRLSPASNVYEVDAAGRLWLGTITVE